MAILSKKPVRTEPAEDALSGGRLAWHTLSAEEAAERLGVDPAQGLSEAVAEERLETYGENVLEERQITSPLAILLEQLTDPMVMILLGAAAVSLFLGKTIEVIAIMAIVVLNALLGVTQEYRAEKAMAALKKMAAPSVRVRRGGVEMEISSEQVVPGDIVLLEAGNIVPADGRVIEEANLSIQESSLTGESVAVEKDIAPLNASDLPIGDRRNMVFMGTAVTYGRGVAVITETGMNTQLGRIASLIQNVEQEKTPLQRRMAELGKVLFYMAIGIVVIAMLIGFLNVDWANFTFEELTDIFVAAVAIAVAVVPEGLPAVVTIALALGAQRMLRRNALIRKLPAVETLGSVTVICSDKTGTLTQNRMTVKIIDIADHTDHIESVEFQRSGNIYSAEFEHRRSYSAAQALLLVNAALSNDAYLNRSAAAQGDIQVIGDPTEAALLTAAALFDFQKHDLQNALPRVAEVPFSSERKRMSTIHRIDRNPTATLIDGTTVEVIPRQSDGSLPLYIKFSKGGVDSLLEVCDRVMIGDQIVPLTPERRQRVENANNQLASEGLRVLGMAFSLMNDLPDTVNEGTIEHHLVFAGMVGMIDPPRLEVKDAVSECVTAGVRPVMITGDHPLTAYAIAEELKIVPKNGDTHPGNAVVTGKHLARIEPAQLRERARDISVYARVSPEHKLNIVQAFQQNGHIVAMTGDGVNDAPALKRADIGVAMGITGTAVSKEAADMVILDDNFATIVHAVEEGRTIYDNVRKFIKYILGSNVGEVTVLFTTQLIGLVLPLSTLQILWMNLVTDGLPALALSVEKGEPDRMTRPPHSPQESLFSRGLGWYLFRIGMLISIVGMIAVMFVPVARADGTSVTYAAEYMMRWNGEPLPAEPTEAGLAVWSTIIFTTLVFSQMGHALAARSERKSILEIGFFSNPAMIAAIALTVVLQLGLIYIPFFNEFFNTAPLSATEMLTCFVIGILTFIGVEIDKRLFGWMTIRRDQDSAA